MIIKYPFSKKMGEEAKRAKEAQQACKERNTTAGLPYIEPTHSSIVFRYANATVEQDETWVPAKYYSQQYQKVLDLSQMLEVSDKGNVRYAAGYKHARGKYAPAITANDRGAKANFPYRAVQSTIEGKMYKLNIARLVLSSFHPPSDFSLTVDHINHDYRNDSLDNLQWMSYADNVRKRRTV